MAFSDFKTIAEVQEKFRIKYTSHNFFGSEPINPSEQFLQELEFNRRYIDVFACEIVIFPVLREVYKGYAENYGLWVKKAVRYDEILSGTPDYLIATRSELGRTVVGIPLVMLVEAKKNDFEQGWGQCLAELVAAQKINDNPDFPVYGIVTDGKLWEFGQLAGDTFTQNSTYFTVDNLPTLFGAVNAIFKAIQES